MYETSVLKKRNLFTSHWVQRIQFQVTFSVFPKVTTLNFLKLRMGGIVIHIWRRGKCCPYYSREFILVLKDILNIFHKTLAQSTYEGYVRRFFCLQDFLSALVYLQNRVLYKVLYRVRNLQLCLHSN